jgi:hypothetical protein
MDANIFVRMKKDKFNPDIESKFKKIETDRGETKYTQESIIYNPITGIIPEKITTSKDLVLPSDNDQNKISINKLINEKNLERKNQDVQYKPVPTKIINTHDLPNLNAKELKSMPETKELKSMPETKELKSIPEIKSNYIETFEEMKNAVYKTNPNKTSSYNNILDGLKELGIIQ